MAAPQGIQPAVVPGSGRSVSAVLIQNPGYDAQGIHGGPANAAHGRYEWDEKFLMPWQIVPGVDSPQATVQRSLVGQVPGVAPQGADPQYWADSTATLSHGAPWPKEHILDSGNVHNREASSEQSRANMALHSVDSGVPESFTTQSIPTNHGGWERSGFVSAGETGLDDPAKQMIGNANTGFRKGAGFTVPGENINEHGFDSAHYSRYVRHTDIPRPPDSTQGAQRPLQIRPAVARNYPVGKDSPFEGQVPGYGTQFSAGYVGIASDYQASPDPQTAPPLNQQQSTPTWGWSQFYA